MHELVCSRNMHSIQTFVVVTTECIHEWYHLVCNTMCIFVLVEVHSRESKSKQTHLSLSNPKHSPLSGALHGPAVPCVQSLHISSVDVVDVAVDVVISAHGAKSVGQLASGSAAKQTPDECWQLPDVPDLCA